MRKWFKYLSLAALAIAAALVVAGPVGPVPGFWIGGRPATPPPNWSTIALPDEVQLRTTGGVLPRVVNIWVVESENDLYVFGSNGSPWVNAVIAEPRVKLRVAEQTFDLVATLVDPPDVEIYRKYFDRYKKDYPTLVATLPDPDEIGDEPGVGFRLTRE